MQMTSRDKYECKSYNGAAERREQETKTEPSRKKSPLRIQNDWSEHISSKGLIYYYNHRTEVSQWQKPNEWTLLPMTPDEIKRIKSKPRNGDNNVAKRIFPNTISNDVTSSPKRIKINGQLPISDNRATYNNNAFNKISKDDSGKTSKTMTLTCSNAPKNKHTEANFNNDDMSISPDSSPLSRGSHSDDCSVKKSSYFDFEAPSFKSQMPPKFVAKIDNKNDPCEKWNASPLPPESSSKGSYRTSCNTITTSLTPHQTSLATALRSTLGLLQLRSTENCLSVVHISELLSKFEAVLTDGGTVHNYRSHRLQTQLIQNSCYSMCNENKSAGRFPANINQIKELVKYLQDFIQDNYPNSTPSVTPASPNYSRTAKTHHYLHILHQMVETCLLQLSPQSLTSPSSTSSPGSLKDNNSTLSVSTSITLHPIVEHTKSSSLHVQHSLAHNEACKSELDSPTKRDRTEPDRPKSVLFEHEMLRFVRSELSNSYRNQLADCYVQEAQIEYYKFVRLHSVLYPELSCESKKLKALVRISEINTELFRQKKDDLERLVLMLDSRRLPSHLRCDYVPNS